MKQIYIYFNVLIIFSSCQKELETLSPRVDISLLSQNNIIRHGDTIDIPVKTDIKFWANSINKDINYLWNFGDGNSSTEHSIYHLYSKNGIYNINLKVINNENKESESSIFVNVIGQIIGDKSERNRGFYVIENESDIYVFGIGKSNYGLNLYKVQNNNILFAKQIFNEYLYRAELTLDNESNFIISDDESFGKFNLNANVSARIHISNFSGKHIYITANNDYRLLGNATNSEFDDIIYVEPRNLDNIIYKKTLYENDNSKRKCVDGIFLNDKDYLLLFNDNKYNDFFYDSARISIEKRQLENTNKTALVLPNMNCDNILKTNSGVILYGFDIDPFSDEVVNINIVKISSDFNYEWHKKIYLYFSVKAYDFNKKLLLREFNDNYQFFLNKSLFRLSKDGILNLSKDYFINLNFQINSVNKSGDKTLVLGTIQNEDINDEHLFDETSLILFKVDENGQIIE